jgi:hypothetical protein
MSFESGDNYFITLFKQDFKRFFLPDTHMPKKMLIYRKNIYYVTK